MNTRFIWIRLLFGCLLLALLAGCATSAQETPTPEPTPIPTSIPTNTPKPTATPLALVEAIEVTFDGNECIVTGPTELPTGEHSFLLKDLSGQAQVLYVPHLLDGKTFQDMVDLQSEPGVYYPKPSWCIHAEATREWIAEGEDLYTFYLNKEGEHAILLGSWYPLSLWFCAPLKVMEAPSE